MAAQTERMDVATGIAWAFTRSPFILALSALDVDELSGGRFRLGLGAGRQAPQRDLARGRVRPPRAASARDDRGGAADHGPGRTAASRSASRASTTTSTSRAGSAPTRRRARRSPIYAAAVREGMARMAGDVADGLVGHPMCSLRWLEEVLIANFEQGLVALGPRALRPRLPADRVLRDRRRRGGRLRGGPPHDRLLRDRAHLHAAVGDARLRRRRAAVGDAFAPATSRRSRSTSPTRWSTPTGPPGPLDKVRARVEQVAERADGVFLTPATYFIAPERDRRLPARGSSRRSAPRAQLTQVRRLNSTSSPGVAQRRAVADQHERRARARRAARPSAGSRPGRA